MHDLGTARRIAGGGGQRGERPADQLFVALPGRTAKRVIGRDENDPVGTFVHLFQHKNDVVRLVQRVVEHPLKRCRVEPTMPHSVAHGSSAHYARGGFNGRLMFRHDIRRFDEGEDWAPRRSYARSP
jgi:hypothetical protein